MKQMTHSIFRSPIIQGAAVVWALWLLGMTLGGHWGLFRENFFMSVTMIFGAFIAGSTSEGGGAIAFPVMTIFAGIAPHVARDFSLMIQSVGMSAAAITIIRQSIPVEWRAITSGVLGAIPGIAIGIQFIAPNLSPPVTKLFFVSLWLVFACALLFRLRFTFDDIARHRVPSSKLQSVPLLVAVGFAGGIVTSLFGTGLDILIFMLLVFIYDINEKVATPTSVVLMAIISIVGFLLRSWLPLGQSISPEAWNYWWVSVPVVVIFAPLGAMFIKDRSREFIVRFLFISVLVQFISAQLLIPQSKQLIGVTLATIFGGLLVIWIVSLSRITQLKRLPNDQP